MKKKNSNQWSMQENRLFEQALCTYGDNVADRWKKICCLLPGRSPEEVKKHYLKLVYDISAVRNGHKVDTVYPSENRIPNILTPTLSNKTHARKSASNPVDSDIDSLSFPSPLNISVTSTPSQLCDFN